MLVLEASDGVGGRVRSDVVDGFVLDRGFQVLLTAYPEARRQLDLDALELRCFEPGALVRTGGGFHRVADPFRDPLAAFATLRAPIGGLADKLRMLRLRRTLTGSEVPDLMRAEDVSTRESLESFGFSTGMIEAFFEPLAGGFLLDPHRGSCEAGPQRSGGDGRWRTC